MSCPAYGSSSGVSVYYVAETDPDAALPLNLNWTEVPITSESLAANLTSSISDRITASRSYANSVITQGEVGGSIGYECEFNTFINTMIKAVLQSNDTFASDGDSIKNGSTPQCFAFMKRVQRGTKYDYYIYRGVQIDSMSFNVSSNSFISGEINTMGVRFGKASKIYENDPRIVTPTTFSVGTPDTSLGYAEFTYTDDTNTTQTKAAGNLSLSGLTALTAGKYAAVLISIDPADGSLTATKGAEADTAAAAALPSLPTGEIPVGSFTIGDATLFTFGTTALSDADTLNLYEVNDQNNGVDQDTSVAGDFLTNARTWTLTNTESTNLMSSVLGFKNLVMDDGGGDVGLTMQDISITFSNQLRSQNAIGSGSPYASGVASGRFQCTLSGTSYYSGPEIIELMLRDGELAVSFDVVDATDKGWTFSMGKCKVTSSPPPQASSPDADLTASTELQAFEDDVTGSCTITMKAA